MGSLHQGNGHSQVTHKKGSGNPSGHTGPYSLRNSHVERCTQESRQAKGFGGETPSSTAQGSEPQWPGLRGEGAWWTEQRMNKKAMTLPRGVLTLRSLDSLKPSGLFTQGLVDTCLAGPSLHI